MIRDPTKVTQTREEKKRKKMEEKAEAKRLAKIEKELAFDQKHDRDQAAQQALANDLLMTRRAVRHGEGEQQRHSILRSHSYCSHSCHIVETPRRVSSSFLAF